MIKYLDKRLRELVINDVVTKHIYTSKKRISKVQIKDKTKQQHKHDLMSYVKCPECSDGYIDE